MEQVLYGKGREREQVEDTRMFRILKNASSATGLPKNQVLVFSPSLAMHIACQLLHGLARPGRGFGAFAPKQVGSVSAVVEPA